MLTHTTRQAVPGRALTGAAAAGMLLVGVLGCSTDTQSPAESASTLAAASTSDVVECPTRTDGSVTSGRDPGDQTSGVNVIKAFDYAYYTRRSGTAARAVVTPQSRVGSAAQIQSAIDVLDQDLRYCLSITARGNGVYGVELTEIPSTGEHRPIYQKITTTEIGGKHWITAIDHNPNPDPSSTPRKEI